MALETLYTYEQMFSKEFLESVYAHKDYPDRYETLEEHSLRTLKKANELISKLKILSILEKMNSKLYHELNEKYPVVEEVTEKDFVLALKRLLGTLIYLHDFGKVNKRFQKERLESDVGGILGFKDSHHSAYGHMLINQLLFSSKLNTVFRRVDKLGFCAIILTTIVNRHHTPLLDIVPIGLMRDSRSVWDEYSKQMEENMAGLKNTCKQSAILGVFDDTIENDNERIYATRLEVMGRLPSTMFFIYKLWYSILVQADCFATEAFSKSDPEINFIDNQLAKELQNKFHSVKTYNRELEKKNNLLNVSVDNIKNIDELRTRMLLESLQTLHGNIDKRIFYLDIPTGGGKTNISIKLALDLVARKNLVRINYVFPFVNIIEQNHKTIEETLGQENEDNVSKIYSFSDWGLDDTSEEENFHLRNQRFLNYPINIISNINFFNIFLKSSKRATMKTLELCNSVVILDEIQSLPNKKWVYFVKLLNKASDLYNIHFIIMSATLPDLRLLLTEDEKNEFEPIKLIENPEIYARHSQMKRVTYEIVRDADPEKEVEEILKIFERLSGEKEYRKILIVANTIANSIEIYKKLKKTEGFESLLLNSTTPPHKRKITIDKLRSTEGRIVLVSTQSVEAGVDIDCDVGIRADAPLDSIEQVAGRVNRNNKKSADASKVFIVPSKSKKYVYSGDVRNLYDISGKTGLNCELLLKERDFGTYYRKVMNRALQREEIVKSNKTTLLDPMNNLEFDKLRKQEYIESRNFTVFLPIKIPLEYFSNHMDFIQRNKLSKDNHLIGSALWQHYKQMKDKKQVNDADLKRIRFLIQCFCVNLVETRGEERTWNFKEFVKATLNFDSENDEGILLANDEFVNKYFDNDIGLDIQQLKSDFKESKLEYII